MTASGNDEKEDSERLMATRTMVVCEANVRGGGKDKGDMQCRNDEEDDCVRTLPSQVQPLPIISTLRNATCVTLD